eukprot:85724-Amorphochlora_amoeboformis.AAC.1
MIYEKSGLLDDIAHELRIFEHGFSQMAKTNRSLINFNNGLGQLLVAMSVNASTHNYLKKDILSKDLPPMPEEKPVFVPEPAVVEVKKDPVPVKEKPKSTKPRAKTSRPPRQRSGKTKKKSLLGAALRELRAKLPPKYNNDFQKKKLNQVLKGMLGKPWM